MNWTEQFDGYCERTDFSFWSEPVNAATNLAFMLVALLLWPRVRGIVGAQILTIVLFLIGIGSSLFHTLATGWAAAADVLPIMVFSLIYIFLATRDYLGLGWFGGIVAVGLFFPFAAVTAPVFALIPYLGGSAGYMPLALLIALYGAWMLRRVTATGRGLLIGAGILTVSIGFRSLDAPICDSFPLGTHFMWHILNALMLGWMILTYRAHMLAGGDAPR